MTMSWSGSRDEIVATAHESGAESVLVRGRMALWQSHDSPVVTVGPGGSGTFDGDRWHRSLVVTVSTEQCRQQYRFDLRAMNDAVERVTNAAREFTVDTLWLHSRARLADHWSNDTITGLERRLTAAARTVDIPLITSTGRSSVDERIDEEQYDMVLE